MQLLSPFLAKLCDSLEGRVISAISAMDLWGWFFAAGCDSIQLKVFSSLPGLYSLDANSTSCDKLKGLQIA